MKTNIIIQDCGIFTNEIIIATGKTKKEILSFMKNKKNQISKDAIKWIEDEEKGFEIKKECNGVVMENDGMMIMLLPPFDDEWSYWEIVLHETHHVVQFITKNKYMEKEVEAQCYLHEYLFRSIRRKLQGIK